MMTHILVGRGKKMQINNWQTPLNQRQLDIFKELFDKAICVPITPEDLGILLVRFGDNEGWPLLAQLEIVELSITDAKKKGLPEGALIYITQQEHLTRVICRSRIRETWDTWRRELKEK